MQILTRISVWLCTVAIFRAENILIFDFPKYQMQLLLNGMAQDGQSRDAYIRHSNSMS